MKWEGHLNPQKPSPRIMPEPTIAVTCHSKPLRPHPAASIEPSIFSGVKMAKSCQTCNGPVSGLFTKVCEDCQHKANAEFAQTSRNKLMDEIDAEVAAAKAFSPSLVKAFEAYWALNGTGLEAARNPSITPPPRFTAHFPTLVPKDEEVIAVASGVQDGLAFWALTPTNILIAKYTLFSNTFKSSELVPISMITGIESAVVNSVSGAKKILVTRAANVDELYGIPDKPAAAFLEALNAARQRAAAQGPAIAVAPQDPAEAIRKLKGLLDDGLISPNEFEEKRKTLLEKM